MKKILIILVVLTTVFVTNDLTKNEIIIPKKAIRFRVIASSNSKEDQELKKQVATNLEKDIFKSISNVTNITEARNNLKSDIDVFKNNINRTLEENNNNMEYSINYGENYFPEKKYKGIKYQEGNYESLVVKLGKGEGHNFWCVLFPPLCLIDEENNTDIEYHFLVKDLMSKYLHK